MKNEIIFNKNVTEKLKKPIIKKVKKRTVQPPFKGNIRVADFADMKLIIKFHNGIRFLWCVIDIFSKYAWVISLKDKKGITITNAFQKIWKEFNRCEAKSKGR